MRGSLVVNGLTDKFQLLFLAIFSISQNTIERINGHVTKLEHNKTSTSYPGGHMKMKLRLCLPEANRIKYFTHGHFIGQSYNTGCGD